MSQAFPAPRVTQAFGRAATTGAARARLTIARVMTAPVPRLSRTAMKAVANTINASTTTTYGVREGRPTLGA